MDEIHFVADRDITDYISQVLSDNIQPKANHLPARSDSLIGGAGPCACANASTVKHPVKVVLDFQLFSGY